MFDLRKTIVEIQGQDYWLVTVGSDNEPGINGALMLRKDAKAKTANMPIPGVGYFAYCQDTEGNIFGIMQADTQAK